MRVLFIGESWLGSSARSLCEALAQIQGLLVNDLGQDRFIPNYRSLPLRVCNRLLRGLQLIELYDAIRKEISSFQPEVVVIYKGIGISAELIKEIRKLGIYVVNVFPDYSPQVYGNQLKESMGYYDLVISTKPFHPRIWKSVYGYDNDCVCVPHGYDPSIHLWNKPVCSPIFDLALCATWRPEYHELMISLSRALEPLTCSVAIAGNGWQDRMCDLPKNWQYFGVKTGVAYGEFLRSAKICISPVNRDVVINSVRQPGDEDTTRTYELAAAYCFFLHQRTDFVSTIFDENTEVPFWDDSLELANLVKKFLPLDIKRSEMAARAHERAVPAYSIPYRALQIYTYLDDLFKVKASVKR